MCCVYTGYAKLSINHIHGYICINVVLDAMCDLDEYTGMGDGGRYIIHRMCVRVCICMRFELFLLHTINCNEYDEYILYIVTAHAVTFVIIEMIRIAHCALYPLHL